jgi:cytochrome c oxidase subunit 2
MATACKSSSDAVPAPASDDPQVLAGFEVAKKQACFGCHKVDGKGGKSGPAFDVTTSPADDAFLRESLTDPDAQITPGYRKGIMSSAMGGRDLTEQELTELVAYLKAVRK